MRCATQCTAHVQRPRQVGRPDGRLNALTSAENTVCLSANQASSIQNFGVTAETLTVGHHPFKLPLSAEALFLPTGRKLVVCEAELQEKCCITAEESHSSKGESTMPCDSVLGASLGDVDIEQMRLRMEQRAGLKLEQSHARAPQRSSSMQRTEHSFRGLSSPKGFSSKALSGKSHDSKPNEASNANATIASLETLEGRARAAPSAADARACAPRGESVYAGARMLGRIEPLNEPCIGAWMLRDPNFDGLTVGQLTRRQTLLQTLYETRVASLQRLVSFMVVFHAMGKAVEDFWRVASLGIFAYDCWSASQLATASHSPSHFATCIHPHIPLHPHAIHLHQSSAGARSRECASPPPPRRSREARCASGPCSLPRPRRVGGRRGTSARPCATM